MPWIKPKVTVRHLVNLSLGELEGRLKGAPNYVRVGLPDTKTTEESKQRTKERRRVKPK